MLKPSTTYTASLDIYPPYSTSTFRFSIKNGNALESLVISEPDCAIQKDKWNHCEWAFTTKDTLTMSSQIVYMTGIPSTVQGYEIYLKNIKVEEGSKATPWIPAPTDAFYTKMGFDDGIEYDVSGYGHNGTKTGTITYDVDTPRYWTSSVFDGNESLIKISDLNLHPMLGSEWTCAFWVNNNDSGGRSIFFSGYGFTTGASFGIEKTTGNATRIYWAGSPDIVPSGYTVPLNQWCHLAFVGTPTSIKCYLNGELKYTYTGTLDISKLVANTTYGIGRDNRTGTTALNGKMSDVRFYATCLSDADILALYNTPISLSSNGTLLTQGEFMEV